VLQKKAADLIDHSGPLADQARSHAVQGLQIQLIVGLYRNATCRWPLHGFRDRVRVSEIVLVTLPERPGIDRWHLLDVMTERDQFSSYAMRRHASLDTDQALRHIRKPCCNPAARELLAQNDRSLSSRPIKCSVFLPVSMPMVRATTASVFRDMVICSSCF
jgi:hypothetical protein